MMSPRMQSGNMRRKSIEWKEPEAAVPEKKVKKSLIASIKGFFKKPKKSKSKPADEPAQIKK